MSEKNKSFNSLKKTCDELIENWKKEYTLSMIDDIEAHMNYLFDASWSFIRKYNEQNIEFEDKRNYIEKLRDEKINIKKQIEQFIDIFLEIKEITLKTTKEQINEKITSVTDLVVIGNSRVLRI